MIPNNAHFIWFGQKLPWIYALAMRSAALKGGFDTVYLHHSDDLSNSTGWSTILNTPRIEPRALDPEQLLESTGPLGAQLVDLYRQLEPAASRANMVRAGLLYLEGGVYLDTDTVTIQPFDHLLNTGVFCGYEHIAMPATLGRGRNPIAWSKAGIKLAARDVFRRIPRGWKGFRTIEPFYPSEVNNAVFGTEKAHPFVEDLLQRMVDMPDDRKLIRYALGTHLLQDKVQDYRQDDLVVHPPRRFYPLSPEISEHWFRFSKRTKLSEVLYDDTVVVHWYASVRTRHIVPQIDPEYVKRNAGHQIFSALALPFVD